MRTHITVLGWLYIVINAVHLLGGVAVWLIMAGIGGLAATAAGPDAPWFLATLMAVGTAVLAFFAVLSLPGIIVGWGLLQGASWARIGGIILSILMLFGPPLGTALGIYGLIVLFNQETIAEFERKSFTS